MEYVPLEDRGVGFRELHLDIDSDKEVYSIGDIHGCIDEFRLLLSKIELDADFRGKTPVVVIHGDMIDRGPSFHKVLELASKHICILGNHEHNFVLERIGKPCNSNSRAVSHEKFDKLRDYEQVEVMDFLNSLYNVVVVNIGIDTFVLSHAPLKNMESEYGTVNLEATNAPYYCMRSTTPDDKRISEMNLKATFVYGHQSWEFKDLELQKDEQNSRTTQYYNIDGGCVYGGTLNALRLSDLGVLSVESKVKVAK